MYSNSISLIKANYYKFLYKTLYIQQPPSKVLNIGIENKTIKTNKNYKPQINMSNNNTIEINSTSHTGSKAVQEK